MTRWIMGFGLIYIALLFSGQTGHAASDDCSTAGADVRVTVKPLRGNLIYDFSDDLPTIQSMANDVVHKVRQGWAIGLTRYEPVLEMTAPVSVEPMPDGSFCARPVSVDVTVGYKDMTISIPSELSGDSCGFDQILRHEEEHIAVSQSVLDKFLPLIKDKIDAALKANGGVREKTADDARTLQQNRMHAILADIGGQMADETHALQQDVDSPEEYRRLLGACDGELAELVKNARSERILAQGF